MRVRRASRGWLFVITSSTVVLAGGCVTVPREAGFKDVQKDVADRTGQRVQWNRLTADDRAVDDAVRELLKGPLGVDHVVQIALLNNRNLQAVYEDLGVAQADVVRAGLLENPIFAGDVKFGEGGHGTDIDLSIVDDFLQVFFISLHKRVAETAFAAEKVRVTAAVIELAGKARATMYDYVAAEQALELRRSVAAGAEASYDLAKRMRNAGNVTELDLAQNRAIREQAKIDLASAEATVLDRRERLNVVMGLWGTNTVWTADSRLPDPNAAEIKDLDNIERVAIQKSLDLGLARRAIEAQARALGLQRSLGILPEAQAGVAAEHDRDGTWEVGPAFSLPIPLFDQGQPAVAAARSQLAQALDRYTARAVEIRASARAARNRLLAARARADYYRVVILPLRAAITQQTQLQYNAMQVGTFQLLEAKRDEVEAGVAYVASLRDYWMARNAVEQITQGGVSAIGDVPAGDSIDSNDFHGAYANE